MVPSSKLLSASTDQESVPSAGTKTRRSFSWRWRAAIAVFTFFLFVCCHQENDAVQGQLVASSSKGQLYIIDVINA